MASPLPPPSRSRSSLWGITCVMLLPAAAGLLLLGGRPHTAPLPPAAVNRSSHRTNEPQFSKGPTPPGGAAIHDLHFRPLEFPGFPAFFSSLRVSCRDDRVTITDAGGNGGASGKTVVWSGPVAAASFVQETAGGIHTLRDGAGRMLWSNAAQIARADLIFEEAPDGQARLLGRGGGQLWTGQLPPVSQGGVTSQLQGGQTLIVTPGVRIEGTGGVFRVTAGQLLWSGRLPASPLIVARDGHEFLVTGPGGSESGSDEASRVSMAAGDETVTIADAHGRNLGTRVVDALTIRRTTGLSPLPQGFNQPVIYEAQDGRLDAFGTLLLTYRDGAGRVVRRSKVYRDARGYGCSG